MVKILDSLVVCRYKLILSKDVTGRYSIVYERLSTKLFLKLLMEI